MRNLDRFQARTVGVQEWFALRTELWYLKMRLKNHWVQWGSSTDSDKSTWSSCDILCRFLISRSEVKMWLSTRVSTVLYSKKVFQPSHLDYMNSIHLWSVYINLISYINLHQTTSNWWIEWHQVTPNRFRLFSTVPIHTNLSTTMEKSLGGPFPWATCCGRGVAECMRAGHWTWFCLAPGTSFSLMIG